MLWDGLLVFGFGLGLVGLLGCPRWNRQSRDRPNAETRESLQAFNKLR